METRVREELAFILARHVAGLRYEDIPAPALEATSKAILDALGVIAGASGTVPGCRELAELVAEAGGKPESTVMGFGAKVPAWMAALANGGMGHGLDYDDIHARQVVHPSACVVPAAFAVAQRVGQVSGRQLLTAVAAGIDVTSRLALAIDWKEDWHLSCVFGAFGCAAAAAKLLGLDEAATVNAFGIALCQAGCTMQLNVGTGSNLRGAYPGFAAKAGVLSACMAQKGIDGPKASLEGEAGLYAVHFRGQYDREAILAELGSTFESVNLRFKPWPACTITQAYIEATLDLVKEHALRPADVLGVTAMIGEFGRPLCEPYEARIRPATTLDAKFSIPFTIAAAIARGNVVIGDYTAEGLQNRTVLELAAKVEPTLVPDMKKHADIYPAAVEIRTARGTFAKSVDTPYGHPSKPMSMADIADKFRDCVRYSASPPAPAAVERVIEQVTTLERVSNAADIVALLA